MAWTPQLLAEAVQTLPGLNLDIEYNEQSLNIKMNDYGDLSLGILFTSRQIIIETVICPVCSINQQNEFNIFLLRNQKLLPLSSVGISRVQHDEYYVAFGALSLNSSLDDVVLEMTTLADNALDLAEITEEYTHE